MKNLKKLLALILLFSMLMTLFILPGKSVAAVSDTKIVTMLALLKGDGSGVTDSYLAKSTTRLQSVIIYLRFLGKEQTALRFTGTNSFSDGNKVDWQGGKNILAYLKANPSLGWVGNPDGSFGPNNVITSQEMHKVMLTTLGYKQDTDFTYANTLNFAKSTGFSKMLNASPFKNSSLASIIVESLGLKSKGSSIIFMQTLVNNRLFVASDAVAAGFSTVKPAIKKQVTFSIMLGLPDVLPGIQTNPVAEEVKKQTGVTMNFIAGDADKMKLLIASGDLPDIVSQTDSALFKSMIDSHSLLPLASYDLSPNDLLVTNGQDIMRYFKSVIDSEVTAKTYDKLYYLRVYVNPTNSPTVWLHPLMSLHTRWDLYKKLGSPVINTEDDYIKLLADMQKIYPTAPNGKKVYALAGWTDWGLWPFFWPMAWNKGYNATTTMAMFKDITKVSAQYQKDSPFWDGMEFWYKANRAGVVDPDSFTEKETDYQAKYLAGQNLVVFGSWQLTDANPAMEKLFPGQNAGYEPIPTGFMADTALYINGTQLGGDYRVAISKNCKDPDIAMDFLNYVSSPAGSRLLWSGVEGKDWTMTSTGPEMTDAYFKNKADDPQYSSKSGINYFTKLTMWHNEAIDPFDGQVMALMEDTKGKLQGASPADLDFSKTYGGVYPGDAVHKLAAQGKIKKSAVYNVQFDKGWVAYSDDLQKISDSINQLILKDYTKLILATSDADFQAQKTALINQIYSMGQQKIDDSDAQNFKNHMWIIPTQ